MGGSGARWPLRVVRGFGAVLQVFFGILILMLGSGGGLWSGSGRCCCQRCLAAVCCGGVVVCGGVVLWRVVWREACTVLRVLPKASLYGPMA